LTEPNWYAKTAMLGGAAGAYHAIFVNVKCRNSQRHVMMIPGARLRLRVRETTHGARGHTHTSVLSSVGALTFPDQPVDRALVDVGPRCVGGAIRAHVTAARIGHRPRAVWACDERDTRLYPRKCFLRRA